MSHIHQTSLVWSLVAAAALLAGCGGTHTHAEDAGEGEPAPAGAAVTLWTDSTELFMEHPALIVGAPDKFAVHLTDLTDFAPLRSGRITLRFDPKGGGAPLTVTQDAPRSPGIYGPAPEFTRPGVYDLTITVESPQARDVIRVPDLRVYPSAEEAPKEEGGEDAGIAFLKEQQWKTPGFATAFATTGRVTESFPATGQIVPAAGRMARLSAPVAGVIEASGVALSPAPGQRVTKGQVLAVLTPALGEGGSAYAEARARLREAEDEHARASRLYADEAIPQRRVHEAEIRLAAAREALAAFGGVDAARSDGRIAIRAPLSGVVASRSLAPGSRVEAGAELFTVVDPSVVWLDVRVPAGEAARVSPSGQATFRVPGSDQVWKTRRTISVGGVIDSVSRTVPVIYEVPNTEGTLKVGMHAQAAVGTGRQVEGVVIPTSAVLDEDGRPIAYVQPEGERFEKRELTLGGTSGDRTLVLAGIDDGERVVTGAAYQVRLASLSTSVPAHGHEH
ncbi:MAG TPA: efflux RND transporter periplasmic adaptor subunit [Candidatus Limnocylindrales bacterium]|nr:efflux RND transporter periplasmic adaptor subunit [Candidatus Limnocylindrales bacterium]